MKRSAVKFRLILALVILFFGYESISALVSGGVRAGGVLRPHLNKKEEDPTRYWTYTGLFSVFTLAACIAFAQSFAKSSVSRSDKEPIQQPEPMRAKGPHGSS